MLIRFLMVRHSQTNFTVAPGALQAARSCSARSHDNMLPIAPTASSGEQEIMREALSMAEAASRRSSAADAIVRLSSEPFHVR